MGIASRGAPERVYADGDTVLVWVDRASGKPVPLPERVRNPDYHRGPISPEMYVPSLF